MIISDNTNVFLFLKKKEERIGGLYNRGQGICWAGEGRIGRDYCLLTRHIIHCSELVSNTREEEAVIFFF